MNENDRYRRDRRTNEPAPHESELFADSGEPQYLNPGRYAGLPDYASEDRERIDAYRHYPRAGGPGEPVLYGTPGPRAGYAGPGLRRGPKGYTRSDERIREDIYEQLLRTHYLDASNVTVEVQEGKVTLAGSVPERSMKHAIEDLSDACAGVRDIDNRIRVERST